MNIIVRPVRMEDVEDVHLIRRMNGVMENILSISGDRVELTRAQIGNINNDNFIYVAEIEENNIKKVVGNAGLHINTSPRLRHSASIGISIHSDYQGIGIGRKLLTEILDLADNWLMLLRLELSVFCDNDRAINLYKSLGFQIEGIKKYAAIRNGQYVDEYFMGRYNHRGIK